jgi:acyl-CoA synthetase (AMP-forming)/AMP-acid ligase II
MCIFTFGMTETMSHIALRKLNGADASDEFTLLEGITIETGEAGNLIIHAPYLSAEPIVTNDLAEITGRRNFRWLGRQDHVINSGGFKIIPELTESRIAGVMSRFLTAGPVAGADISTPSDHTTSDMPDTAIFHSFHSRSEIGRGAGAGS